MSARAVGAMIVLVVCVATARAAPADVRLGHIKALLENQGLKVLSVDVAPAKPGVPALWSAGTAATYRDPSWDAVTDQALNVWNSMFVVLRKEDPKTILASAQEWRTYRLFVSTTIASIAAFDAGARKAKTDADRAKVFQELYKTITLRVLDVPKQQLIDPKTFTQSYFK